MKKIITIMLNIMILTAGFIAVSCSPSTIPEENMERDEAEATWNASLIENEPQIYIIDGACQYHYTDTARGLSINHVVNHENNPNNILRPLANYTKILVETKYPNIEFNPDIRIDYILEGDEVKIQVPDTTAISPTQYNNYFLLPYTNFSYTVNERRANIILKYGMIIYYLNQSGSFIEFYKSEYTHNLSEPAASMGNAREEIETAIVTRMNTYTSTRRSNQYISAYVMVVADLFDWYMNHKQEQEADE